MRFFSQLMGLPQVCKASGDTLYSFDNAADNGGANAVAANGGNAVKVYAPGTYSAGYWLELFGGSRAF